MEKNRARFILRLGLAFAFIYPAVAAWFNPLAWIGFFPASIRDLFPGESDLLLLHLFGITELIIGMWLIVGRKILTPSILASVYLVAIILANIVQLDIIFRDVSILAMALALILIEHKTNMPSAAHSQEF